jgi:CysZ protein
VRTYVGRHPQPYLGVGSGLRAFADGIGFIISTPAVWGHALVPAAVTLVLMCGLGGLGVWGALKLGDLISPEPGGVVGRAGLVLLDVILVVVGVLIAVLLSLGLAQPLSSFALLAIVDVRQRALTGVALPRQEITAEVMRTLGLTLLSFLIFVPLFAGLFIVSFLFPPAAVVTVPIKFVLCSWLMAWNFIDYPLSLRHATMSASLNWSARHLVALTAFGMAWALLAVVPPMVLLFLPMGVAGATRLVVESEPDWPRVSGR